VSVSCPKKFFTGQDEQNQCHKVEQDEKKIDPAELVEDRQENIKRKYKRQ
jgi:hypothetical protein